MSVLPLLARIDAFFDFVNRVVNVANRFHAMAAFIRRGCFEICLGVAQQIERALHVRLIERSWEQGEQRMIVAAIEADAFIDFGNSGVDVANRCRAVATFIAQR